MGISVMAWVVGLIIPNVPGFSSVNQMLPSGPDVMLRPAAGAAYSVTAWVARLHHPDLDEAPR